MSLKISRNPILKKFYREDFPDETRNWIDKLLSPLNDFVRVVSENLNKKITFEQNMYGFTTEITTVAGKSVTLNNITIANQIDTEPFGVFAVKLSNMTYPLDGINSCFIKWDYDATTNSIIIKQVTGINTDYVYKIRLVIIGG